MTNIQRIQSTAAFLIPTLALASVSFAASLDPAVNALVGTEPSGVTSGDFDNDGDMDLATTVDNPDRVVTLLNDGNGTYTLGPAIFLPASSSPQALIAGDFDNNGTTDLAVAVRDPQGSVILLNNVGGTFMVAGSTNVGDRPRGMSMADADGDGDMDLAVANRNDNSISILTNMGGTFSVNTINLGGETRSTSWGDFDADGDMDLAASNHDARTVVIYRNDAGTFVQDATLNVGPLVRPDGIALADLNGDGRADVSAATSDQTLGINEVAVFLSTPTGFAGPMRYATGGTNTSGIRAGDMDCDGDTDLVVSNQDSGTVAVMINNGTGALLADASVATGVSSDELALSDADGDGDLDIAVAVRDANSVAMVNNTTCQVALPCVADCAPAGGNGEVNIDDILAVINSFGDAGGPCDIAPLNPDGTFGNGDVNWDDIIAVVNAFGPCP